MTKNEFSQAVKVACDWNIDLSDVDGDILNGCYTPEYPKVVSTTIEVVAKMIRHVCVYLNGEIDTEQLNTFRNFTRRRIEIV